jgi:hypothetical protein
MLVRPGRRPGAGLDPEDMELTVTRLRPPSARLQLSVR